MTMHTEGKAV